MQFDGTHPAEGAWAAAVATAEQMVFTAEELSRSVLTLRLGGSPGLTAQVEAHGYMAMARGALATLEVLRPGDPEIEALRRRLNHCPILQLVGEDRQLRKAQ